MLIFLHGEDTYRSLLKLKEILRQYQSLKHESIDTRIIDCENAVFSTLGTELRANSLFQTKKLLVLKNLFANRELLENISTWKKFLQATADTVVFFEQREVPKSNSFAKFLAEHAKAQEFAPLGSASLKTWIQKEFLQYQVKTESLLIDKLIQVCGNDLWKLAQEVQKLAAFAKSQSEAELRGLLLETPPETDIFATINTLKQGNKRTALKLLASHFEKGESPFYLVSMFAWGVRSLAKFTDAVSIKTMHEKVFQTDLAMKTGRVEPTLALFSLAASL